MCPAICRALTRTCSVALETQLGALWWPRWLGWGWGCEGGQRGGGGYLYTYNWLIHCIAETNTILESNYTQIKFFSDLSFILYPADLPDSMMSSHTVLIVSLDFLCICKQWQFYVLVPVWLFPFLFRLLWLESPELCWIKVARVNIRRSWRKCFEFFTFENVLCSLIMVR